MTTSAVVTAATLEDWIFKTETNKLENLRNAELEVLVDTLI